MLFYRDTRSEYMSDLPISGPSVIESCFFEDGEPNFVIPRLASVTGRKIVYVADWSSPRARMLDLYCLWPLAEMTPALLTIIIPFDPCATQERETSPGVVATASVNAKLLSSLPCAKRIVIIDLHTEANKFFFYRSAVFMASMMPALAQHQEFAHAAICFPDDGAKKRFAQYFTGSTREFIVCVKQRVGDRRQVCIADGDAAGRDVLIVDDLVRTGGTLGECARVLRTAGAKSVCVFVTHMLMPQTRWDEFVTPDGKYWGVLDAFFTSDTTLTAPLAMRAAPASFLKCMTSRAIIMREMC